MLEEDHVVTPDYVELMRMPCCLMLCSLAACRSSHRNAAERLPAVLGGLRTARVCEREGERLVQDLPVRMLAATICLTGIAAPEPLSTLEFLSIDPSTTS